MRFEGFGADEDEWVNVNKSIRQRSIPLESSQCKSIVEGDLVLCFRVSGSQFSSSSTSSMKPARVYRQQLDTLFEVLPVYGLPFLTVIWISGGKRRGIAF